MPNAERPVKRKESLTSLFAALTELLSTTPQLHASVRNLFVLNSPGS